MVGANKSSIEVLSIIFFPPMVFPIWIFASFETVAYVAYMPCCSKGTVQNHDSTLSQISHEMTPEDATLHEMLSIENGSSPYFFSSISIRHWGTQRRLEKSQNIWPPWAVKHCMDIGWSLGPWKGKKYFCIGPAPDLQMKLPALCTLVFLPGAVGEEEMPFAPPIWTGWNVTVYSLAG